QLVPNERWGNMMDVQDARVRLGGDRSDHSDAIDVQPGKGAQVAPDAGAAAGIRAADGEYDGAALLRHIYPSTSSAILSWPERRIRLAALHARSPVLQQSTTRCERSIDAAIASAWSASARR